MPARLLADKRDPPSDLEQPCAPSHTSYISDPVGHGNGAHVGELTPLKPPSDTTAPTSGTDDKEQPYALTRNPILWAQSLSRTYSWRLLAMVVCTNHMLKGFVAGGGDEGLVGKPVEFIFGSMGIAAGRMQMFKAAAIAPWALKPAIALVSDALPIFGYRKMPYVVITTVLAVAGALLIGMGYAVTAPAVVAALFLIFLQVSSVDLLVEARQSEEVKKKPRLAPQFFTFTWLGINAGQLVGMCLVGALIHYYGPRVPYLVAVPFMLLVLWPTLSNFLGERPVPREEQGCNLRLLRKHPVLCWLTVLIAVLIVVLIVSTFVASHGQIIALALGFALLVLMAFFVFIRREISGPVIFYFLLGMLSFNVDGALFYFYTDSPKEYPAGPHFSTYFYTTALGCVTFLGVMVGFVSGTELFKSWSYRGILMVTIVLRAGTQLALVPTLLRWTVGAGIPDGVWVLTVCGLDTMVYAWRWIPKQVMGAHLTPHGVEATMLGLTAGTFNMAMILSSYCGGYLLHRFGIRPTGEIGDSMMFVDLWKVQVLAALAPCATLFLLPVLIPAKTQTEPLIVERPDSATHGSWFEVMSARASLRRRQQQQ